MAIPKINREKCNGCEECVEICPAEAISMVGEVAVINEDECTECSECVETCPEEAITEEE